MHGERHPTTTTQVDDPDLADVGRGFAATSGPHHPLLREVNDQIAELSGSNVIGVSLFVCECGDLSCAEAVEISSAEYARIRADGSHFAVYPGHERPESERVVDRNPRFVVVASRESDHADPGSSQKRRNG